jgi:hypothetical protein
MSSRRDVSQWLSGAAPAPGPSAAAGPSAASAPAAPRRGHAAAAEPAAQEDAGREVLYMDDLGHVHLGVRPGDDKEIFSAARQMQVRRGTLPQPARPLQR